MSAVTVVYVLLAILIVGGIGMLAVGGLPEGDAVADEPPPPLPEGALTPEDFDEVRFPLAFRGYRQAEVDEALDRAGQEIAARDAEIVRLQQLAGHAGEPLPFGDAPSFGAPAGDLPPLPDAPGDTPAGRPATPYAAPPPLTRPGAGAPPLATPAADTPSKGSDTPEATGDTPDADTPIDDLTDGTSATTRLRRSGGTAPDNG